MSVFRRQRQATSWQFSCYLKKSSRFNKRPALLNNVESNLDGHSTSDSGLHTNKLADLPEHTCTQPDENKHAYIQYIWPLIQKTMLCVIHPHKWKKYWVTSQDRHPQLISLANKKKYSTMSGHICSLKGSYRY